MLGSGGELKRLGRIERGGIREFDLKERFCVAGAEVWVVPLRGILSSIVVIVGAVGAEPLARRLR